MEDLGNYIKELEICFMGISFSLSWFLGFSKINFCKFILEMS